MEILIRVLHIHRSSLEFLVSLITLQNKSDMPNVLVYLYTNLLRCVFNEQSAIIKVD